ncbi:MAG TPA: hypothetical protein VFP59_00490 [Candidatus Angelobacter sp.]|nr:hypothetical protein [Candidatus Angelobacter sp.]
MLSVIDRVLGLIGALLEIALAAVLVRGRIWRKGFPFFFLYICYAIIYVLGLLLVATFSNRQTYARIYWIAQAGYALLGLAAMNESFRQVFAVYYFRRRWFQLLVPGVVFTILSISVWKWLSHAPIQAGPLTVAYISFDLAMNYMLAGVFALFGILAIFWRPPGQSRAFAILFGFGLFSVVGMIADALRSDFGTKMNSIFSYSSAVAYILASAIWLRAFIRKEHRGPQQADSTPDPGELLNLLTRHTKELDKNKKANRWK